MSKDKVVNVRITLAEAFYQLYKRYEKIDIELGNRELPPSRFKVLRQVKEKLQDYLNRYFYRILRTLKYDPCETVREFMMNLNIYSTRGGGRLRSYSGFDDASSIFTVFESVNMDSKDQSSKKNSGVVIVPRDPEKVMINFDQNKNDDVHRTKSMKNPSHAKVESENKFKVIDDAFRSISASSDLLNFGAVEEL